MRILIDIVVIVVFGLTGFFLYQSYWDDIQYALFGDEQHYVIYLGSNVINVTVADEESERIAGLSGVPSLPDLHGKLFIFDAAAKHGIWMKDMLIPLDIIWFDENLSVIHIEENVHPNTYPKIFVPPKDARFVLEMNAHYVSSIKIALGNRLTLPPALLPVDIREALQKQ